MTTPATTPADGELLCCPFCGGPVELERATEQYSEIHGRRQFWGVVCRNTLNRGGTCAIHQIPSASKEAAIERWNRRATPSPGKAEAEDAARYRRIRNGPHSDRHGDVYAMVFMPDGDEPIHGAKLDSIIDAAMERDTQ